MTRTEQTTCTTICTQNMLALLLSLCFKFMNALKIIVSRRKLKVCVSACLHITKLKVCMSACLHITKLKLCVSACLHITKLKVCMSACLHITKLKLCVSACLHITKLKVCMSACLHITKHTQRTSALLHHHIDGCSQVSCVVHMGDVLMCQLHFLKCNIKRE
jgi:hypothetical protein